MSNRTNFSKYPTVLPAAATFLMTSRKFGHAQVLRPQGCQSSGTETRSGKTMMKKETMSKVKKNKSK